jgi:hypothetical protein
MRRAADGLLFLAFLSCSCVSTTPEGEKVRLTSNPEIVRGCRFILNVQSDELDVQSAENVLRNKAAEHGGNVVLMVGSTVMGDYHSHSSGEVYSCGPPPPPPTNVKLKPGEEIVSEDLVPPDKRLTPLPKYQIVTIRATEADGTTRIYQRYAAPDEP